MESGDLAGRTALITGASTGIGRATGETFAANGADLAIAARSGDRLAEHAAEWEDRHGCRVHAITADVRSESACRDLVEEAVDRLGDLDIVVNNAGVSRGGAVESLSTDDYRTMQETNVDGTFFVTRAAIPHLRKTAGNLVFIGSFAGKYPRPFNPVYAASKWWVRGFAHSVMAQVGDDDIGVTVVNPSEVRSNFGSARGAPFSERFSPGEAVEPETVAEAVLVAARQDAATFSEIDVNRRDKLTGF